MKNYLFSYDFRGGRYSFEVPASSAAEAKLRVQRMANSEYDGEVALTVYVPPLPLPWRWLRALFGGRL